MYHAHRTVLPRDELVKQRHLLETSWDDFLRNPETNRYAIRSVVYESWKRCLQSGVDPRRTSTDISLKEDEIQHILQYSKLYDCSFQILQDLSFQIKDTGYLVTLCDPQGRILFLDGNREVLKRAERMNFVVGADWSERAIGTNAIGTCLEVGRPVQIFAAEHFCAGVHDWTCSSAPIRDPVSGDILGVIDVTGLWHNSQPHTLGMVTMACHNIQFRLLEQAIRARYLLLEQYQRMIARYPSDGVMVLDAAFHPVEVNETARKILRDQTGKDVEELWDSNNLRNALFTTRHPANPEGMYEIEMEHIGVRAAVQEVHNSTGRIGYVLVLRPCIPGIRRETTVSWEGIVGRSAGIRTIISKCDIVAQTGVPVLLLGESGTGKELFARAIHRAGPRRDGPFVAVNCGALPKELLASELFGYAPGAFTGATRTGKKGKFEEADGGTLFLDEVGEMPPEFQVHLLRVLQEREIVRLGASEPIPVNVRIIAATHRNLEQMVRDGLFREDLYFRLNVVTLSIPPLRERREDIALLIDHFLTKLSEQYGMEKPGIDPSVREFLIHRYSWPGNVRELKHVLEHAVLFCNRTIQWHDLPETVRKAGQGHRPENPSDRSVKPPAPAPHEPLPSRDLRSDEERQQLLQLLQEVGGNLSEAARRLKIARTTLYRRLNKYGIRKSLNVT
ncbi:MAG: sigma-54-dependent Fis family transcriptional regulator [Alicyclobacillaceae bacterium]|nr:sigma-54-dependent Fis family transcriptional regulator [Alicyclobacillaceae bacterium]